MLNIPESVKDLYKLDSCRKNFRVHFPNGELSDITNDNVVQESVEFSESICSQDVFRFGLAEASTIKFEAVGVANMYGMTIQCFSEIDCSSLSVAQIEEIEDGEWDGEYVPLDDSDLGYSFFRVPYGTFRVDSCPRDHQAMTHRKVEAYSDTSISADLPLEEEKLKLFFPWKQYRPDIDYLFHSSIAQNNSDDLSDYGFEKETVYMLTSSADTMVELIKKNGDEVSISFVSGCQEACTWQIDGASGYRARVLPEYIYRINTGGADYRTMLKEAAEALDDFGIDYAASGYSSMEELIMYCARMMSEVKGKLLLKSQFSVPSIMFAKKESDNTTTPIGYVPLFDGTNGFYTGFSPDSANKGLRLTITIPRSFKIYEGASGSPRSTIYSKTFAGVTGVYRYSRQSNLSLRGSFESTLTQKVMGTQWVNGAYLREIKLYNGNSFSKAYSIKDIIIGFLEIAAQFERIGRDGKLKTIRISQDSPVPITPPDYTEMWWDEYDVNQIGTIRYAYTDDAGEEQIVNYQFGDGTSVYDMTDNAAIKAMDGAGKTVIESMLDTYFIPHLNAVNFTPVDIDMKGLPYIEAGDAITATAQDGVVCNSYALRHEISGIQSLSAQVNSESGLILDSEEEET